MSRWLPNSQAGLGHRLAVDPDAKLNEKVTWILFGVLQPQNRNARKSLNDGHCIVVTRWT
eukprot:CAMPEP_0178468858 /NCGR_PEP_ID=MMETSP0689_2-20121128/53132_1 /TAXON_ID=160604 /ORGANISM="Amphidinium massartii, Strain CS-259" /LENGTH=59 /DNA_ID=CAMNT_0020095919 /DNA_START=502 /DNA_END=681 /DNA_ORIENTATION=-